MIESSTSTNNSARFSPMGTVISWDKTPTGLSGKTGKANFQVTVYQSGVLRIQINQAPHFDPNPYSIISSPSSCDFGIIEEGDFIVLTTEKIRLKLNRVNSTFSFYDLSGKLINADDPLATAWIGTEVTCYKQVQVNEKFIGLGEKTGNLNRFGKAFVNWNTDYFGYGIEDDPLYMSIPFYIGIHGQGAYGIYFDNTHKSVFNFGASTDRFISFGAEDGDMDYYFIHEPSVSEIITTYTSLTGKMQMPPKWSLGFQQCRYSYYPDKEVTTLAQTFRDKAIPADVIYLDIHHMEEYKVFTFDDIKFPDPKAMIRHLKSLGFRVVVIMDPGIKKQEGYLPYDEGVEDGLFIKYPDGQDYIAQVWPGWCAFPDFTKPDTRKWWAEKMEFYTEAGVDGFWADMNEPASWGQFTPNLIEFDMEGNPSSHRKSRNVYGMLMAKSANEGSLLHNPSERPFILTRSGFAGIQRYAAAWTGDNQATDEHMLLGVRLVNSLGMSGVSFSGYDVGGFAGESRQNLYARWMSIGAFSPFFRAHTMINSKDAEPWAYGEEVEEISRNYIRLRYQLLPTIYSKIMESTINGLPISSSLAIDYGSDEIIYQRAFQNQYLFCNTFLVIPVESYKEITRAYLPEGNWYYLYSDEQYTGQQLIYQDCPLSYLPVFVKAGSIFTMQSPVMHTGEKHDGILRIHVYEGADGTFTHYEDDGISWDYQESVYHKRIMEYHAASGKLTLQKASGSYPSEFSKIQVYFHGFQFTSVSVNGEEMPLSSRNYRFLNQLTEFDPLPESAHPYIAIGSLPYIEFDYSDEQLVIG
ncbi:TIM-barrel domain-containing protein [Algoriphagus sp. NG3]|uniref:glycoside hydrolase family 31 protein n=1 Tax=Algoriphagus sp. NG3 TaxID=3097546 RepID=UPI002A832E10|nr:TIM-barrel domain-containing protein [Algoriphagus sp. NG3]WPR77627.1 glycoside hydrolase family 31 protein [Algoriphagus sp. NG3]